MKYISMKMDPNGSIPEAGMTKEGLQYQGAAGIGRGIEFTLQGGSYLPIQCLPKIVPTTAKGKATNAQIAIILKITETGIAEIVS
mmetsp:Transcript_947/g.1585  ORF Transcript_947/g.1585 Transcript_947/m.1585 type:complete len:85 (+) Transcript_947:583-837(+)